MGYGVKTNPSACLDLKPTLGSDLIMIKVDFEQLKKSLQLFSTTKKETQKLYTNSNRPYDWRPTPHQTDTALKVDVLRQYFMTKLCYWFFFFFDPLKHLPH